MFRLLCHCCWRPVVLTRRMEYVIEIIECSDWVCCYQFIILLSSFSKVFEVANVKSTRTFSVLWKKSFTFWIVKGVLLDLSKIFECINRNMLLTKFNCSWIRGTTNMWFKCYLQGRSQLVIKSDRKICHSEDNAVVMSVPQGNILGDILFLIYKIDLNDKISVWCFYKNDLWRTFRPTIS